MLITMSEQTELKIVEVCENVAALLIEKNRKYGDSALCPMNVFSKDSASDSIRVRLDDKLSRVKNSDELRENDVLDIIGYMILLTISNGWDGYMECD